MSFLSGGQLSTDKQVLHFFYIFTGSFPVWAAILAQTGNEILVNSSPNRNDEIKYTNRNDGSRYMQSQMMY